MSDDGKTTCTLCGGRCRFYDSWYALVTLVGGFLLLIVLFNTGVESNSPTAYFIMAIWFFNMWISYDRKQNWICTNCGAVYPASKSLRKRGWHEFRPKDEEQS